MNRLCLHTDSCFSRCLVQVQAGRFIPCQDENKAYQMQLQFLEHVPLMKRLPKDSPCGSVGMRERATRSIYNTSISISISISIFISISISISTYIYLSIHLSIYLSSYLHTYIHACMHACIHTNIQTYIHTYIHRYIIIRIAALLRPLCHAFSGRI